MWMTRKRLREEMLLALNGRGSIRDVPGDDYVAPLDPMPSYATLTTIRTSIENALAPYAHLICEHDFKSKDSACPAFVCAKCGMRNPRWEWQRPLRTYYFAGLGGPSMPSLSAGEWKAVQLGDEWWEYRDWPKAAKPKRGKRAR